MSDYYLSAPSAAVLLSGLAAYGDFGQFDPTQFDAEFAIQGNYGGPTPDGGSWQLVVLGQLSSPAPSSVAQPVEPGNFTNRVGLPIQPPYVTGTNLKVGIESIPDTVVAWWAKFSWNSSAPLPNFQGQGLTVYPANVGGSQGQPFGQHF